MHDDSDRGDDCRLRIVGPHVSLPLDRTDYIDSISKEQMLLRMRRLRYWDARGFLHVLPMISGYAAGMGH